MRDVFQIMLITSGQKRGLYEYSRQSRTRSNKSSGGYLRRLQQDRADYYSDSTTEHVVITGVHRDPSLKSRETMFFRFSCMKPKTHQTRVFRLSRYCPGACYPGELPYVHVQDCPSRVCTYARLGMVLNQIPTFRDEANLSFTFNPVQYLDPLRESRHGEQ